jgi:acetyl-CoA carboxylase biotin carboxyl carrier protein
MNRFPFSPDAIRMLADILVEKGLVEIELAEKDSRIRIVQAPPNGGTHNGAAVSVSHAATAPAPSTPAPASPREPDPGLPGAVLSPMVGVAYLAPEPEAPPFVTVGQKIEAGQTLLLLEAMKSFTTVAAPIGGVVKEIRIEDGKIAEFGQLLMILE